MEQNCLLLGIQDYLTVVEEVNLEDLVTHSEHDCMTSLKPLLHIDKLIVFMVDQLILWQFGCFIVEVTDKSLQQHILFLEVPLFGDSF